MYTPAINYVRGLRIITRIKQNLK